ncbi:MAG: bile acid:sodium symporter family protein [Rugosibacter sp.]|jgi:BASS family bile acid:Na+ symporter|nr:bile acid:sodium symporter family protein [Rugosibacter sp.]MDO9273176.1 bile acid:sodium symporter family protein [Rugosibacter sp.]
MTTMNLLAYVPTLMLLCLGLMMFGLGLSLTLADFVRLKAHPKAVVIALSLQLIILPLACYVLIVFFDLTPIYAVGLMLLAASPGGISANLFSHLFGGNLAMNISLTAINTVLSIITLPLIANLAIEIFAKTGQVVPLQMGKVIEVIVLILIPVSVGMLARVKAPRFAARMDKPMKIFSALLLLALMGLTLMREWNALLQYFSHLGPAVVIFNLISLFAGFYVSRLFGLDKPMATAISYEIGIHNAALAMYIGMKVLNNPGLALPSAIYSASMLIIGAIFGFLILGRGGKAMVSDMPLHRT